MAKIVNVMLSGASGGLEQSALNWHRLLSRRGYVCKTICHPDGMGPRQLGEGEVQRMNTLGKWDLLARFRLQRALRGADIVLLHGNRALALADVSGKSSAAHVAVLHNQRFRRKLGKLDAVICVTRTIADEVGKAFPALPRYVVPNFIDVPEQRLETVVREPLRIGALGRLHHVKGFDVLIDACAILKSEGVRFHLEVAGDGPGRGDLERQARSAGLGECVCFAGWVDDKPSFFDRVDVLVAPSRMESFGISVVEALAYGRPVVASATPGPLSIIEDGWDGIIVPLNDPGAIARAIAGLAADAGLRNRLASNGALAAQRFSFESVAGTAGEALDDIRSRARRAPEQSFDAPGEFR